MRCAAISGEYVSVRFPTCQSVACTSATSGLPWRRSRGGSGTGGAGPSATAASRAARYTASRSCALRSFSRLSWRWSRSFAARSSSTISDVCSSSPAASLIGPALVETVATVLDRRRVHLVVLGDTRVSGDPVGDRLVRHPVAVRERALQCLAVLVVED